MFGSKFRVFGEGRGFKSLNAHQNVERPTCTAKVAGQLFSVLLATQVLTYLWVVTNAKYWSKPFDLSIVGISCFKGNFLKETKNRIGLRSMYAEV